MSLSSVAGETVDLDGEACLIYQQSDQYLWIDPALLGVANLAVLVILVGLEIQGLCRLCGYADVLIFGAGQGVVRRCCCRHNPGVGVFEYLSTRRWLS